ncbi:MAG TPA: SAM-dependent methyltransferase [Streptosporangiaceae bacterium]|nr:SAM-dependent methyltransferase [Streptosporangiaceae bacterium]
MTPSRTSQAVAVTRAGFARSHSPAGDPDAQRRLCAGMRAPVLGHLEASLEARTIFFDGQVVEAISSGVRQIVILGAGYDDRALRFRTPGVRFFEVDHPNTQQDKRSRLAKLPQAGLAGPVLVAADFRVDALPEVLAAAGHDRAEATLFLCEGLLVYLDEQATIGLLDGALAAAGPGSSLAASLAVHADGLDSAEVLAVANARRRTAEAEPWLTILPADAQVALLSRAGWRVTTSVDAADLGTGAEPGRSLLVTSQCSPGGLPPEPPAAS